MSLMKRFVILTAVTSASGEVLPEITVMSERTESSVMLPPGEWSRAEIRASSPRTLDELLAEEPSFSLYRRQTSLFGNPTSAGVSLRNTGATAASRTLVLRDGIPQNDPFGGWVYWSRYDPAAVDSVRIVSASEAAVWGNQSPAGAIHLSGGDPFDEQHVFRAVGGSHGTFGGSTFHRLSNDDQSLAVMFSASGLHSDGFFGVAENQRGSVDRRLEIDFAAADLKLAWKPRPGLTVEPMFAWYDERRGNGTPLTGNSTEAFDFALRLTGEEAGFTWQATAYHQKRSFESFFSSVNATRTAETPSLDQFDVPGSGTGAALTFRSEAEDHWSLLAGADFRHIDGETREEATFTGGRFTRLREAGGEQGNAGAFLSVGYVPDDATRFHGSLRGDAWWLNDGRRVERSLINGSTFRNERQKDRDGIEPSFSISASHDFNERLNAFVSAGTSFRLPTLNELHRPFRVRNDIVEANPGLDPERFFSVEGGFAWKPAESVELKASLFHHWIKDAIANVPVTDPTEISEIFGTIPAGGSGSQRRNVEEARVAGVQAEIEWFVADDVTVSLDGIWTETKFSVSPDQPLLEGNPFPQAPDLRLSAGIDWRVLPHCTLSAGYEYGASQFDDAMSQRRIADYTSARVGVMWKFSEHVTGSVRVENLFDEEIQTGLGSDGTVGIAGPRSFWATLEWAF
jgi:outer membrane receptor protein involved in Fe transport